MNGDSHQNPSQSCRISEAKSNSGFWSANSLKAEYGGVFSNGTVASGMMLYYGTVGRSTAVSRVNEKCSIFVFGKVAYSAPCCATALGFGVFVFCLVVLALALDLSVVVGDGVVVDVSVVEVGLVFVGVVGCWHGTSTFPISAR